MIPIRGDLTIIRGKFVLRTPSEFRSFWGGIIMLLMGNIPLRLFMAVVCHPSGTGHRAQGTGHRAQG